MKVVSLHKARYKKGLGKMNRTLSRGEPALREVTVLLQGRLAAVIPLKIQAVDKVAVVPAGFSGAELAQLMALPMCRTKLITERACTTTQVLHEIHLHRYKALAHWAHWGLNE